MAQCFLQVKEKEKCWPGHLSTACGHTHVLFMNVGWLCFYLNCAFEENGKDFLLLRSESTLNIWHPPHGVWKKNVKNDSLNSLRYSCLENAMNQGAWWAAVHRVTQSWTRMKRLSTHACIGEGNDNPLQYSCLENARDRGAW